MKRKAADILKEALALPSEERAALAASLLDSLDTDVDEDAEAAWAIEVNQRVTSSIGEPSRPFPGQKSVVDSPRADPRVALEFHPLSAVVT